MKKRNFKRYTLLDELTASPTSPLPEAWRIHQLTKMYESLNQLEQGDSPTPDDWRICSDVVNLVETMVVDMKICQDESGLLMDAITALATAGKRSKAYRDWETDRKSVG